MFFHYGKNIEIAEDHLFYGVKILKSLALGNQSFLQFY